jgi:hypothetical protein
MHDRYWRKKGAEEVAEAEWYKQLSEPAKQWLHKKNAETVAESADSATQP